MVSTYHSLKRLLLEQVDEARSIRDALKLQAKLHFQVGHDSVSLMGSNAAISASKAKNNIESIGDWGIRNLITSNNGQHLACVLAIIGYCCTLNIVTTILIATDHVQAKQAILFLADIIQQDTLSNSSRLDVLKEQIQVARIIGVMPIGTGRFTNFGVL